MNWSKYSGYYLFGTGVIHTLIGVALGWQQILDMHQAGWWMSTITPEMTPIFDREFVLWFIVSGVFWMLFGALLQTMLKQGFQIPRYLGWSLLAITLPMIVIIPISGAYFFLIQAVLLILGDKSDPSNIATT